MPNCAGVRMPNNAYPSLPNYYDHSLPNNEGYRCLANRRNILYTQLVNI